MCSVSILLRMSYFFKSGVIISVRRGNIQNSLSYGVGKPYRSMKVGVERWRFRSFLMTLDCLCVSDKLSHHLFQVWESRTGIREYSSSPFKTVPCSFFFFFPDISVADIWPARQTPGSNGRKREWSARGRNTPRSFLKMSFQARATQTISDTFQSVHSVFALIS